MGGAGRRVIQPRGPAIAGAVDPVHWSAGRQADPWWPCRRGPPTGQTRRPIQVAGAERGIRGEQQRTWLVRAARTPEIAFGLGPAACREGGLGQPQTQLRVLGASDLVDRIGTGPPGGRWLAAQGEQPYPLCPEPPP